MIHQKPISLSETLAAIGGAVVLSFLGWAIVHPLMVLNHVAHDTARLVRQHEQFSNEIEWTAGTVSGGWVESNLPETLEYTIIPDSISIQCGMYLWLDRASYGAGLEPDYGYWDLETVIEKIAEEK